jgi:tetratricopeptide (TPR) repeat protein
VIHRAVLFLLIGTAAFSQKLLIEVDTQEGQLLQQIDTETTAAKKLALLEQFAKSFPNHEAINWVLGQIQLSYVASGQNERVLEVGTRLLGLDPDDVSAAHNCLKAAEAKKDVDLIRRWADQTSQIARKVRQFKKPEDPDEVDEWKQKVEYAKQVEQYTEYALYFAALQTKDTATKAKLIDNLEQKNPTSEYLAQLRTSQTTVVRQVDIEEAVAAAEASFKKGEYNIDSLMMAANHLMAKRRDSDKVIAYSSKLVEMLNSGQGKPADLNDADWDRKRRQMLGTANWMMGLLYSTQERFGQADRALRQALPNLKSSDMIAGALYHLGYVNYRLAEAGDRIRIHDAVRYTSECIAINSAVQQQAVENLKSMKAEYNLQ